MKKIIHLISAASVFVFFSCNNGSSNDLSSDLKEIDFNKIDSATQAQQGAAPAVNTNSALPTGQRPLVNPPHGQPWHDCSIDEGKPLPPLANTPVNSAAQPVTTQQPIITQQQLTSTPAGQKPLLNPPHGQPWHDCTIDVGKPLSSAKPQATQPVQTATQTPGTNQQLFPNLPAPITKPAIQPTTANTPRPKLNPAHGQPWHDCAITVGQPLPPLEKKSEPAPAANDSVGKQ